MKATEIELQKLQEAIKHFEDKIQKQGRITNAFDEEHLNRLRKIHNELKGVAP